MSRFLLLILGVWLFNPAAIAQRTTMVNHYPKDTTGLAAGKIVPARSEEHRIVINYYEHADEIARDQFQQLVSTYLSLYIERCAYIDLGDVKLRASKKETLRQLNSIVKGALDFYDYEKLRDFKGFSAMVEQKLAAIATLDFREVEFSVDEGDSDTEARMQRNYLNKELSDLKLLVNMEVGIYGDENLMVVNGSEEVVIDDGARQRLLQEYLGGDKLSTLEPIRVEIGDGALATIDMHDHSKLNPIDGVMTVDANARLIALMEASNSKLDGMQKQIDELRTEQLKFWQQQQDDKNLTMQKQIDDLRDMVFALVKMNTGDAVADVSNKLLPPNRLEGTVTNLPGSMNVYFNKGSVLLDAGSVLSLNEIVDILARSPQLKLMVTGFADRSGDPAKNLVLSQQRANAVKHFLVDSGLQPERFITKYFGDRDSATENGNDRKVMVEFVRK